ncbi:MAG TPA: hypothetical protein VN376_03320 [Longilinea sp.]|nr:hypothetical protein [Longilinea sp.]
MRKSTLITIILLGLFTLSGCSLFEGINSIGSVTLPEGQFSILNVTAGATFPEACEMATGTTCYQAMDGEEILILTLEMTGVNEPASEIRVHFIDDAYNATITDSQGNTFIAAGADQLEGNQFYLVFYILDNSHGLSLHWLDNEPISLQP